MMWEHINNKTQYCNYAGWAVTRTVIMQHKDGTVLYEYMATKDLKKHTATTWEQLTKLLQTTQLKLF